KRNTNTFFKAIRIGSHIHKGQLKMNRAVKKVEKATPFIKNSSLVLLLCQLVVDVLKLNGFSVVAVGYTANTIGKHSLKRDRLLGSLGNTVIFSCSFDSSADFSLLLSIEMGRSF